MSTKTTIFLTGATGFLGGGVLSCLLNHPNATSFEITALVRSADKGQKLQTLGIKTVLGSYTENLDVLTEAASHADVVFTIADSDNLPATHAILDGLKIKYENTGKAPILIHTSGTAIIMDDARGLHGDHRVYSDLESQVLDALPDTALHRNVDRVLVDADTAGYVKAYIVCPGTVFGTPTGPLVDLGIQNVHSIQIPYFVRPSIIRKQGSYIGKGLNQWPAVDVDDVVDLFSILFSAALKDGDSIGHGVNGYYFAENFHYSGLEMAQAISDSLLEQGVTEKADIGAFSQEEAKTFYGNLWPLLATNCYAKADRARALGWTPKRGKEDFIENVKSEVRFFLKQ